MTDAKGLGSSCQLTLVQSVRNRMERYLIVLWRGTSSLNDGTQRGFVRCAAATALKNGALLDNKRHVVKVRFNLG